jgi:hypothetical protein
MGTFNQIWAWIKANILLSIGIGIAVILVFFPKMLRGLTGSRRRVHHRIGTRRVSARTFYRRPRRALPRSVSMYRTRRTTRRTKGPKKPWQIKGSKAARLHMARIRRMR